MIRVGNRTVMMSVEEAHRLANELEKLDYISLAAALDAAINVTSSKKQETLVEVWVNE